MTETDPRVPHAGELEKSEQSILGGVSVKVSVSDQSTLHPVERQFVAVNEASIENDGISEHVVTQQQSEEIATFSESRSTLSS